MFRAAVGQPVQVSLQGLLALTFAINQACKTPGLATKKPDVWEPPGSDSQVLQPDMTSCWQGMQMDKASCRHGIG